MNITTLSNTKTTGPESTASSAKQPPLIPPWVKWRNSVFDRAFYDIDCLTAAEQHEVMLRTSTEGEMMVVRPGTAEAPIEYYSLSADLIERYSDDESIDTIAIPGVGSSDLGTAALARTVADVTNRPVIGVIPGYGALDMMSEALGGWFVFGMKNRMRAYRDAVGASTGLGSTQITDTAELGQAYRVKSTSLLTDEPESNTIINLLLHNHQHTRLLVGHSKGCLNISNALHEFVQEIPDRKTINTDIEIVTFGCGVQIPPDFKRVRQYVGEADMLGRLNTPTLLHDDKGIEWLSGKVHTLSRWHPMHMPAEELIGKVDLVR